MSFLLSIAGIDKTILDSTKNSEAKGFFVIGWIAILFFVLNFISTVYLLTYLVDNLWIDIFMAIAYASIVFNFYRFTLSSIIWRSMDFKDLKVVVSPSRFATGIRMIACGFFIVIMSKPIELYIFHSKVMKFLDPTRKEKLYEDLDLLHQHYPVTWIITIIFLVVFLWPIWYRSFSDKWGNKEYEVKHFGFLMQTINEKYEWFKQEYNQVFSDLKIKTEYKTPYANAPFNTELNKIILNTKGKEVEDGSNKEFYHFLENLPTK